jgi:enoyl-CoA hydratase
MGDALNDLEQLPLITIAAINGPARGGGAELAIACDLRLMAEEASIAFVHASLGLIPGWGGGERLQRIVGPARALEYISTARVISAGEAFAHGLINSAHPGERLMEEARKLASNIAGNSPLSVAAIKRLFREYQQLSPAEARLKEREAFVDLWDSDERREIFKKFSND